MTKCLKRHTKKKQQIEITRIAVLAADAAYQIEQLARDAEHQEKVSVLPMLCGTGKSTGISEIICQTIEAYKHGAKEGLLIIATNTDQMNRYLKPFDTRAESIIAANRDLITLITAETKQEGMARLPYTPVLIMTAQRYFRSSADEIKKLYISFGDGCKRTLTLIDEQPPVYECLTLSPVEINAVDTALRKGLDSECSGADVGWTIQKWDEAKSYYNKAWAEMKSRVPEGRQVFSYKFSVSQDCQTRPPCEVSDPDSRFWSIINNSRGALIKYHIKNREKGTDPYLTLVAMRQWMHEPSIFQYRNTATAHFAAQFILRRDNTSLLSPEIGTKFIILDGTGSITPDYDEESVFFRSKEPDHQRDLSKATIRLYDLATGRSSFLASQESKDDVMQRVYQKLDHDSDIGESHAIFSYQDAEKVIKDYFPRDEFGHFGALRGRNDFAKYHHIVQIGLSRYNDVFYKLYEYGRPEDVPDDALNEEPSLSARSAMNRLLQASVEQAFFRGSVRNTDDEPYVFSLFLSFTEYGSGEDSLIDMLTRRFHELGVNIERYGKTQEEAITKIRSRRTVRVTRPQLFWAWYNTIPNDAEYSNETLREVMKIKSNTKTRDAIKNVPTITATLKKDFVERKGNVLIYRKKG